MFVDEYLLTPMCCRLILKAVVACSRHAEYIRFFPFATDERTNAIGLRVSSIDTAGVSILSFDFNAEFFLSVGSRRGMSEEPRPGVFLSAKNSLRAFKNVSPNKIISASFRISGQQIDINFNWKCGIESKRILLPADLPDGSPVLPTQVPASSQKITRIAISFSPRYLSGILGLIPDSPTLWKLCVSRQQGDATSESRENLFLTNEADSSAEVGSVVGLTLSQSELHRNGSYFRGAELENDLKIQIPLSELKSISSIASDEVLKDAFVVQVGFESFDGFHGGAPILAVQASAANASFNHSHMNYAAKIWFKGCCTGALQIDEVRLEDLNLDEIDPDHNSEDAILAAFAETMESSSPFILHSTRTTQEQHSTIPEWDSEIPCTPPHVPSQDLEDLWF